MKYLQLKSHFLVKYRILTPEVWEQARLSALTTLFNTVLEITANAVREAEKSEAHNVESVSVTGGPSSNQPPRLCYHLGVARLRLCKQQFPFAHRLSPYIQPTADARERQEGPSPGGEVTTKLSVSSRTLPPMGRNTVGTLAKAEQGLLVMRLCYIIRQLH